ncbi:hypothetical protein RHSIM_RhsimUnG0169500 [Rhododendron simsii]|uniref:Uncharacterized protein n=1 Tax=Rhododendron simsii TaxID=118357 RepID=A0A834L4E8_RHOSS|nr:hypothetical protein RHSIM_RhsimUnG0169500 [Rhododendron simsii]
MAGQDCTDGYKDYEEWIQAARESPMPWIGMYVAKASRVCSVAMAGDIPATESYMELKYKELHEIDCNGGKLGETENLTNEKLKEVVEKCWVMEETGSPQFVTARSVTSAMLGAICVQIGIVVASKLVHLISSIITLPLFSCFYYGKRMNVDLKSESSALEANNSSPEFDHYVLQLECEVKLPKSILKNMCHEFDQLILMGKSRQPQNLLELLRKSNNSFKGVVDFDSNVQVQYCWMLPVVTLTSIAVALPVPWRKETKSVRRAAHFLGETEEILAILKHPELLSLSGNRAAYIDEWRSYMMQKDPPALVPSSDNEIPASGSDELHINVDE